MQAKESRLAQKQGDRKFAKMRSAVTLRQNYIEHCKFKKKIRLKENSSFQNA